ncbi:MAG TPA: hypothetical protein VHD15_17850 [Hyphomicrobiales bacterium]|nr:hypothetical protein [Hyphomicrobiales bacterium]
MSEIPDLTSEMSEMPDLTSELVRFVARAISGFSVDQWNALPKKDRIPFAATARAALAAERRFVALGRTQA